MKKYLIKERTRSLIILLMILTLGAVFISIGNIINFIGGKAFAETNSSAQCMVLLETSSNRVLYQKNQNVKRPMASTTKILTAITVIENKENLDEICKVPPKAVGVEGSSIYLEANEELSLRDLLYGLMLQSGNDCAEALAILTSGSKEKFAVLMNETAKKIGALNSNFVTPHGLDHNDHYTTAYDLALITSYALKNPDFAEIVRTKRHTTTWKGRDYKRVIINKNKLLSSFVGCDGVKTGYTKKAGRCYVSSATKDGMQVVCVVLNCGPMFEECSSLMSRAFNEYKMTELLGDGFSLGEAKTSEAKKDTVKIGTNISKLYPLTKDEAENIKYEYEITKNLRAPLKIGSEIGKIKILLQNELLFEEKLYNIESIESRSILDRLKDIAWEWNK